MGSRPIHVDRPKMGEISYLGEKTRIPAHLDTVEPKMDGMYGFLDISHGQWTMKSRTGNIKADGVWPNDVDNYILIGEYMKGSHWAKRKDIDENSFYVFDILWIRGVDLRDDDLAKRRRWLRREASYLKSMYGKDYATVPRIQTVYVSGAEGWRDEWHEWVDKHGYEGLVFKDSNSVYDSSWRWMRMKKEVEMDYICVGFEPASEDSKYKGLIGGVKGTLIDKDVIVECGGLTDAQRQEYTNNPEKYKGRIFTAKGNDWYPSGSIRHPKFREWRNDKTHYECSYTQVPEDIRDGVSE